MIDKRGKCPLFEFCNCKTAICRIRLPDESCYWYRYFKIGTDWNNKEALKDCQIKDRLEEVFSEQ